MPKHPTVKTFKELEKRYPKLIRLMNKLGDQQTKVKPNFTNMAAACDQARAACEALDEALCSHYNAAMTSVAFNK